MKKMISALVLAVVLAIAGTAMAQQSPTQPPPVNVSHKRHPNLNAAERLCAKAYDKIMTAQQDNEFDMDGHAQKAKELLDQADTELKAAAEAANKNGK